MHYALWLHGVVLIQLPCRCTFNARHSARAPHLCDCVPQCLLAIPTCFDSFSLLHMVTREQISVWGIRCTYFLFVCNGLKICCECETKLTSRSVRCLVDLPIPHFWRFGSICVLYSRANGYSIPTPCMYIYHYTKITVVCLSVRR